MQHRVGLVEMYFTMWAVYDMRLTAAVSSRTSLREDLVCTTCGEGYFEEEITDQLLELVEEAAGAGVEVRCYVGGVDEMNGSERKGGEMKGG